jgi:predicted amidohydrolase
LRQSTTVAAYQAPLLPGGSMAAVALIATQVRACEAARVDILCCPEAVLGGLADYRPQPADIALDVDGGTLRRTLDPLASDTVTTIVGFTERGADDRLFNAAAVFSRGAVIGIYRKQRPAIHRSVYEPGSGLPTFTIDGVTFAIVICRDSTFPDLARSVTARGATVLFIPTNNALPPSTGGPGIAGDARRTDCAIALENDLVVVRADVAGHADGLASHGSSAIVDRTGHVLDAAKPLASDLIVREIDIARRACSRRQAGS